MNRRIYVLALPLMLALSACGGSAISSSYSSSSSSSSVSSSSSSSTSSSSSSSSSSESSSSISSSSSSSSLAANRLEVEYEDSAMREGGCFLDSCRPIVTLVRNKSFVDVTGSSSLTYSLTNKDSQKSYLATSSLPVGDYVCKITYLPTGYSASKDFTVFPSSSVEGKEGEGYMRSDVSSYSISSHPGVDVLRNHAFPSIGNSKMLVVPVYFSDVSKPTSNDVNMIDKAFFGEEDETGWESLSSYYKKSSYGKLDIGGLVSEPYKVSKTCLEFENSAISYYSEPVDGLLSDIESWAKTHYDLPSFDSNKDGFVDGISVVYFTNRPIKAGLWWAYTSDLSRQAGTKDDPRVSRYFWSPSSLVKTGYYSTNIDCHTIIHESGHMMGLDDYYDYDSLSSPAGFSDMMDFNVGDQNAWSKMSLGWIDPMVVDGSAEDFTLSLRPMSESGDCLILRNTIDDPWNKTPYDEFLLLQYYAPTELNELDSHGYREWMNLGGHGGTYSDYGLQLFHVDGRLYKASSGSSLVYTDEVADDLSVSIASSNTQSRSVNVMGSSLGSPNKKIEMIPASYSDSHINSLYGSFPMFGTDSNLFTDARPFFSQSLASSLLNEGKFNDDTNIGWNFEVLGMSEEAVELRVFSCN